MTSALLFLMQTFPEPIVPECNQEAADRGVQQEMNICAEREFLLANNAMREQFEATLAAMRAKDGELLEDPSGLDGQSSYSIQLIEAQRNWVGYRGHHCRLESYRARGGSLQPLLYSTCKTTLTEERTKQLAQLIEP